MPLLINLRHLESKVLHLEDTIPAEELDLDPMDAMIHIAGPLSYDLQAEKMDKAILVQGRLRIPLKCECVRCLNPFQYTVDLAHWACHIPLQGEDKAEIVNDCVDLTPYVREDILLGFPQHPLCKPECKGLSGQKLNSGQDHEQHPSLSSSAWAELNKLKLK